METKEFISKAEELLGKISEIENNPRPLSENLIIEEIYPELVDLRRDILHLIYAYDPNLPLLQEIKDLFKKPNSYIDPVRTESLWHPFFSQLRFLIQYFIQYLKDFG